MKPSEHKTVQARILAYAQEIGWSLVSREEAERRRGIGDSKLEIGKGSLFFEDLLHSKVQEFNPRYAEAEGALPGKFRHLHTDIYGNREFVEHLRNRGKFFDHEEKRERDLILIDYEHPERNVYEVTEEFAYNNGHYGTRQDVVFLINGIPVLVIECKNATKDEGIALGIDQIRRYHEETPELFVPQQLFTATDAIGFSYGVTWNTVRRNIFEWKGARVFEPVNANGKSKDGSKTGDMEKNGLENPCSVFYRPKNKTDKHRRNLPHWQQGGAYIFVTWRLGDSLPADKLKKWQEEKAYWLVHHPQPWDLPTEKEYHERFSRQIDEWLDQGSGSCLLRDSANAKIVGDALLHFDGERYELGDFVVMPNHVHVLFRPADGHRLEDIVKSWKGFSAREINKRTGKKGALWQEEYWDRLIRNERHFGKCVEYIRANPVKAGLRDGEFLECGFFKEDGFSNPSIGEMKEEEHGLENPCPGRLEEKVKTFCTIPRVLAFLKEYIIFAEKDEELNKYILRQHQTEGVEKVEQSLNARGR